MTDTPQTLIEAVRHFSDPAVTFKAMIGAKWPDGKIACPRCGWESIGVITSRSMLQCKAKGCRKQFSVKVGTFAEDSPLPLGHWMVVVWCIADGDSVSSTALGKALGITQPSAWFMQNRIRTAIRLAHHGVQSKRKDGATCNQSSTVRSKASRRTGSVVMALSGQGGEKAPDRA